MKLYQDKKWLEEQYLGLLRSGSDIASEAGVNRSTIYRNLRKHDLHIRGNSEARHLAVKNELFVTEHLRDMLYGELLGDGNMSQQSKWSAYYQHSSKYMGYLLWLSGEFASQDMQQAGKITVRYIKKSTNPGYYMAWKYASLSYAELVSMQHEWYQHGIKIVPHNLKLNPVICLHWYIGDGSLYCGSRQKPYVLLCTCGFDKQSLETLIELLSDIGIKATLMKSANSLRINAYSTPDFLSYIGLCPPEIESVYGYKWDLNRTCTIPEWQEQYKQQHNKA